MAIAPHRRARRQVAERRDRQGAHRRQGARRRRPCAGRRPGCQPAAEAAAKLAGVAKVLVADDARYAHHLAEPMAALIVSLAGNYDAIVAPATTAGKNVMPRVAALLDVMQISEISKVDLARHLRAADLCRQRHRDRAVRRHEEGRSPSAPPRSRRRAPAAARRSRRSPPPTTPASPTSSARNCRSPTGRS